MRWIPLCALVLATVGCKSPETKACERIRDTIPEDIKNYEAGTLPELPESLGIHICLEDLEQLRSDLEPTQEEWDTYLRCLGEMDALEDMMPCGQPLFEKSFERAAAREMSSRP